MSLRVLLTGFEVFQGAASNPSGDIARDLDGRPVTAMVPNTAPFTPAAPMTTYGTRTAAVRGVVLPVVWATAGPQLIGLMTTWHPHIALSLGMAAGDPDFRVESTARDLNTPMTDNAGALPATPRTHMELPASTVLLTQIPIQRVVDAIRGTGPTARENAGAGAFLCEDVFFELMLYFRQRAAAAQLFRAGFIHMPYNGPSGYGAATRALYGRAIEAALRAIIADLTPAEYATAMAGP